MNVNVTETDTYAVVIGENIYILRKYALSYLGVNGHDASNLFSNGSENRYCVYAYTHFIYMCSIYFLKARMRKWMIKEVAKYEQ